MQVVGVDFGTTNVRMSTWDSNQRLPPEPKPIGNQGTTAMPAVIALKWSADRGVSFVVGENADDLVGNSNTLVIRNIKRLALSSDPYVGWHLKVENSQEKYPKWPPKWWNAEKRCVQKWGQEFPVWDLIRKILDEAFRRAEIVGEYEWRAGCPVHADLKYRYGLSQVLSHVSGTGDVNYIVEEPILLLTLARRLGNLEEGSYLVYDLGGGSFDCAIVEIKRDEMLVYGANGHPLLGGSDIDDMLVRNLGYEGQPNLMRAAKERLTAMNSSETMSDGTIVTWRNVEAVLRKREFIEKSLSTMMDAYRGARVLWKRGDGKDDPPIGEIASRDAETGAVRHVWELKWDEMAKDVDKIILFGGPTKSSYFLQRLSKWFGKEVKITTAADLLPTLTGTSDLELVGVSMGACYSYEGAYVPLYVNRLPVRITLQNRRTADKVQYEPFQNFTPTFSFDSFVSEPLVHEASPIYPKTYRLTITRPNGVVLERKFIDEFIDTKLIGHTLRLVIDRDGLVGVEQISDKSSKRFLVFDTTPWQTGSQRQALQRLFEQEEKYRRRQIERGLSHATRHPWEYPNP